MPLHSNYSSIKRYTSKKNCNPYGIKRVPHHCRAVCFASRLSKKVGLQCYIPSDLCRCRDWQFVNQEYRACQDRLAWQGCDRGYRLWQRHSVLVEGQPIVRRHKKPG